MTVCALCSDPIKAGVFCRRCLPVPCKVCGEPCEAVYAHMGYCESHWVDAQQSEQDSTNSQSARLRGMVELKAERTAERERERELEQLSKQPRY